METNAELSEAKASKNTSFFKDTILWIGLLILPTMGEYIRYVYHLNDGGVLVVLAWLVVLLSASRCKWKPTHFQSIQALWCLSRAIIALILIRQVNGYCGRLEIERENKQIAKQFEQHNANPREWALVNISHPRHHFFDLVDRTKYVYQRVVERNGEFVLGDETLEITTE